MIAFLLLSAPIFGVVAVGWAATRSHLLDAHDLDTLAAFSFRFALPALVFRLIATQPIAHAFNPLYYGGYLASGGLIFGFTFAISRLGARNLTPHAAAYATTASTGNQGFLGPPLLLAFIGERGAGPLAMAILAEVMVLLSIGGALMGKTAGNSTTWRRAIESPLRNPIVVAVILGSLAAASGLSMATPLDRFLIFVGGAAGPTALFAVGGALALQRIDVTLLRDAATISAAKLIVYPVIVWLMLGHVLGMAPFWVHAGIITAALPSAGNTFVIAQRFGADPNRVSAAIVVSTILSVLTVPVSAWLILH